MDFLKYDQDKPRMDYLPQAGLWEVGRVATYGAGKYAPNNWKLCRDKDRYVAAALRHINLYLQGEDVDKESGLSHLAHAAWSLLAEIDIKKYMEIEHAKEKESTTSDTRSTSTASRRTRTSREYVDFPG